MVRGHRLHVKTRGQDDILDLTEGLVEVILASGIQHGIVTVFVVGSTAAITTIEYEPGLARDFPAALERIAPKDGEYAHEERWHDDNGHSHVRASLVGPSLTIPLVHGKLALGTWQQVVLVECDTRQRQREVIVQIVGET